MSCSMYRLIKVLLKSTNINDVFELKLNNDAWGLFEGLIYSMFRSSKEDMNMFQGFFNFCRSLEPSSIII